MILNSGGRCLKIVLIIGAYNPTKKKTCNVLAVVFEY
jgi:hypothetical protein